MKIIQRYITVNLLWTTLLALSVLVALFSFFALIDQLEEAGKGNYGVPQVLVYVLLTMPRLAYELFPIAAVIGSMASLGILAKNSELDIIRTSGVSKLQLAIILGKSAIILVIIAILIGELIAPMSEQTAQQRKSIAMTQQIALKTKYGFWARDGNSFINIRKVLPGDRVEKIYIYEFDKQDKLRNSIFAKEAKYVDGQWLLEDIQQTVLTEDKLVRRRHKHASWDSLLNPEIVNLVIIRPQYLTIWELYHYISYMKQNSQNTQTYEQALWTKFIKPFSIIAMILLAVPLVRGHSRFTAIGQRVFVGAAVGIIFHIINQAASHMGVVYNINPFISVTVPTLILISTVLFLLRD